MVFQYMITFSLVGIFIKNYIQNRYERHVKEVRNNLISTWSTLNDLKSLLHL